MATPRLSRRRFLAAASAAAVLPRNLSRAAEAQAIPIIDCHIHLFDPTRPQGVPWPDPKADPRKKMIYRPTLPARFRRLAAPLGVRGAIEVECSPWLEDNQWVLDVAGRDAIMVGTVGDLEPGDREFPRQLERFARNPLYRGIRYGNLWGRDLGAGLKKPEFVANLKRLSAAGLVLDTANQTPRLLADVVRATDLVPALRVVIDHLPALNRPAKGAGAAMMDAALREISQRPQIYVKISEVMHDGAPQRSLPPHRERIDQIFGQFGPDRVLFGSDWPNSEPFGTYAEVLGLVREYFLVRGREVAEKYFWRNSVAAYRWVRRDPSQPPGYRG